MKKNNINSEKLEYLCEIMTSKYEVLEIMELDEKEVDAFLEKEKGKTFDAMFKKQKLVAKMKLMKRMYEDAVGVEVEENDDGTFEKVKIKTNPTIQKYILKEWFGVDMNEKNKEDNLDDVKITISSD